MQRQPRQRPLQRTPGGPRGNRPPERPRRPAPPRDRRSQRPAPRPERPKLSRAALLHRANRHVTVALAIFALIFLLVPVLYLVLPKKEISEAERRSLQPFPKLTAKRLFDGTFNKELETFLSDHMPGRNALIKTDQGAKRLLTLSFGDRADEDKVELIQGKREVFDEGNVMQRPDDALPAGRAFCFAARRHSRRYQIDY